MNKTFLYSCYVFAFAVNLSILSCNRQEPKESSKAEADSTPSPAVSVETTSKPPPATAVNSPMEVEKEMMKKPAVPQKNPFENSKIEIKTFPVKAPATGYGYDISIDGKPYLHQYNIPAMPGNNGFSSEVKAHKAAEFVAYKIKHNIMPPSVNERELDSIGVLK